MAHTPDLTITRSLFADGLSMGAHTGNHWIGGDSVEISFHNLRKTFATRLLNRGAAITDVQHLLGHSSVKTTERAYAAFVKNERFRQTIDLLDQKKQPVLKVVR